MFTFHGIKEVNTVTTLDKKKIDRKAISFIAGQQTLGLEPVALLELHLTMHVFLCVSRVIVTELIF